jgi:hypothetical protein
MARRLRKVEAQLWQHEMAEGVRLDRLNTKWPLGRLFSRNESDLTRLQRRIDSTDRLYHRALDKLERLQANPVSPEPLGVSEPELPAADPIPPQSAQEEPSVNQRPTPEFGFVPQPENPGSQPQPSGWGTPSASQPPGYYSSAVSSPPRRFAPLSPGGAVEKSPARERWEQSWDTQAPERGERTGRVAARVPRILQRQAGPHRPRVPDLSHRPLLEWSFTSPSDPS